MQHGEFILGERGLYFPRELLPIELTLLFYNQIFFPRAKLTFISLGEPAKVCVYIYFLRNKTKMFSSTKNLKLYWQQN